MTTQFETNPLSIAQLTMLAHNLAPYLSPIVDTIPLMEREPYGITKVASQILHDTPDVMCAAISAATGRSIEEVRTFGQIRRVLLFGEVVDRTMQAHGMAAAEAVWTALTAQVPTGARTVH